MEKVLALEPRHLKILKDIFEKHLKQQNVQILAYGSRVSGEYHEGSDLDLVVRHIEDPRRPIMSLPAVIEDIRESRIPILVDIFDWARLPEEFHKNIEKNCLVIWPVP